MHTTALFQQDNAPWGIARLSSTASFAGQNPNSLDFKYAFEDAPGLGTEAFVIDTGCRVDHIDFGGRANFIGSFGRGIPNQDANGREYIVHLGRQTNTPLTLRIDGTHVAGTVGGNVFGVAKNATLNCIKVMADDGSGATSDIISGISLASTRALASGKPSVISMSLGGPVNRALDQTVRIFPSPSPDSP